MLGVSISAEALQASIAPIEVGYYYQEPEVIPGPAPEPEPEPNPGPGPEPNPGPGPEPNPGPGPGPEPNPVLGLINQFIRAITSANILVLVAIIGAVVIAVPTTAVIAIRRSRSRSASAISASNTAEIQNNQQQQHQHQPTDLATTLFQGIDPVALENEQKRSVMAELEEELGTSLNTATNINDLCRRFTGEKKPSVFDSPTGAVLTNQRTEEIEFDA